MFQLHNPLFAIAKLQQSEVVTNQHAVAEEESSTTSVHRAEIEEEKTSIFELNDTDTFIDLEADGVRFYFVPSAK